MIKTFYIDKKKINTSLFKTLSQYASQESLGRYRNAVNIEKGKSIVLGECLLKYMICLVTNVPINKIRIDHSHGRPCVLSYPNLFLSLSHAADLIIATVADIPIGCDVEYEKPRNLQKIECFFSNIDCNYIKSNPKISNALFYQLWTRRESFLKLCGINLNENINYSRLDEIAKHYNVSFFSFYPMSKYIITIATDLKNQINCIELKEIFALDMLMSHEKI